MAFEDNISAPMTTRELEHNHESDAVAALPEQALPRATTVLERTRAAATRLDDFNTDTFRPKTKEELNECRKLLGKGPCSCWRCMGQVSNPQILLVHNKSSRRAAWVIVISPAKRLSFDSFLKTNGEAGLGVGETSINLNVAEGQERRDIFQLTEVSDQFKAANPGEVIKFNVDPGSFNIEQDATSHVAVLFKEHSDDPFFYLRFRVDVIAQHQVLVIPDLERPTSIDLPKLKVKMKSNGKFDIEEYDETIEEQHIGQDEGILFAVWTAIRSVFGIHRHRQAC